MHGQTIKAAWVDVDQTLLDFDACAKEAMEHAFHVFGYPWKDDYFQTFLVENAKLWDRIEEGSMTREELGRIRFTVIFNALGMQLHNTVEFEDTFISRLRTADHPMPGALEALQRLDALGIPIFIASNGSAAGQLGRLERAGMGPYFRDVFSSSRFGVPKPDLSFFTQSLDAMNELLETDWKAENVLMIGDSWKADIRGALPFGANCIWFKANRAHDPFEREDAPRVFEADSWDEISAWIEAHTERTDI